MTFPTFDPYPLGCPLSIALTPAEMQQAVLPIGRKLRDIVHLAMHEVNPSKGDAYPMLNLVADGQAAKPRLVLFPAWEDNRLRRRITWKRQDTLMRRIHDAGVQAEALDFADVEGDDGRPLEYSIACTAADMGNIIHDLNATLGDITRLTVSTLPRREGPDLHVVKLYAPNAEEVPRVVFYPGWTSSDENPAHRVDAEVRVGMRMEARRVRERPVELFVNS